jgi:two-component sensor histidine kinase
VTAPRAGGLEGKHSLKGTYGTNERRLQKLYVIAAASLAALVPLILFAGFWIRSELNKSRHEAEEFLAGRAAALSRRVDAEMEHQLLALRALSALPDLDAPSTAWEGTAERLLAVVPHWNALALIDAESGEAVLSTRPGWPARDLVRPEVRGARNPSIRPEIQVEGGRQEVVLYVPVVRNDASRHGIAVAFDPVDFQEITAQESRKGLLLLTVTDGTGRILARSRAPDASLGREMSDGLRGMIANRQSGMFESTSVEGDAVAGSFSRSSLTGWVSLVSVKRNQVDRMSNRSVWATVAAGVLSLILAGILSVYIVHTVMERRVSDERLAASRALGELDARLLATTQEALGEQRKASSEREVLLREIYHRVKNNLQIVQSLLRLGSRDLKAEQREPFEAAVRRVGAMARVHTLLYNSPDLASIDFKDYLDELLKELSEGFAAEERSITSVLNAHSMRVPLDTAVPLAFIAVEILTNSFRHAFPEGRSGSISVDIARDEPFGTLRIEDDGVGFTHDPSAKRRLGLTIVRKLVQQIGGSMEEPEPGSSAFLIRFPLDDRGGEQARRRMEVAPT